MIPNYLTSIMGGVIVLQLGLILNYLKKTISKVEQTETKVQDHEFRIKILENEKN